MSSEIKPPVVGNHGRMKKLAACSINAMTQYKLGWQVKYGSMKNIKRLTTVFLVPWKLAYVVPVKPLKHTQKSSFRKTDCL